MERSRKIKIALHLKRIILVILLSISILVFLFALVSGSEKSLESVIQNSPNTLPWLLLFVLIYIAKKWELAGGILISFFGLFLIYFFNSGANFFIVTFILTLVIFLLGIGLLLSWFLKK